MNPIVSIIIPTFNRAEKIIKTLESVVSQNYLHIEIIVVDDGSTDHTQERIYSYIHENFLQKKLFYYKQENSGAPEARNYGLKKAEGSLVIFFDSDDLMLPDRISKQVKSMLEEESDCCSCGFIYSFDGVKHIPKINKDHGILRSYMNWDIVGSTACWMYKKDILIEIGGYDLNYACYQDWDITFRYLTKSYKTSIVDEVLNIVDNGNQEDRMTSQLNPIKRIPNIQRFFLTVIKWSIINRKNRKLTDIVLFSYVHQITLSYLNNIGIEAAKKSIYSLNQVLKDAPLISSLWYKIIFFKHLIKTSLKLVFKNLRINIFLILW